MNWVARTGRPAAICDAAMHGSMSASLQMPRSENDTIAGLFEAKLIASAKEYHKIVQRCFRNEEWLDADESFVARQAAGVEPAVQDGGSRVLPCGCVICASCNAAIALHLHGTS